MPNSPCALADSNKPYADFTPISDDVKASDDHLTSTEQIWLEAQDYWHLAYSDFDLH